MRIGELARKAGVDVQTVRFYEREGLLDAPARTGSGYRAYGEEDLERLHFVRHCRSLDMPLAEIRRLIELSREYLRQEPLVVEPGVRTGMPILYEPPGDVGADRIVNGVAALAQYGGPVVVVDFGTATTFDVVTRKGEYAGGVICPGVGISADALFQRAAPQRLSGSPSRPLRRRRRRSRPRRSPPGRRALRQAAAPGAASSRRS